jgi:hypothetical protein
MLGSVHRVSSRRGWRRGTGCYLISFGLMHSVPCHSQFHVHFFDFSSCGENNPCSFHSPRQPQLPCIHSISSTLAYIKNKALHSHARIHKTKHSSIANTSPHSFSPPNLIVHIPHPTTPFPCATRIYFANLEIPAAYDFDAIKTL